MTTFTEFFAEVAKEIVEMRTMNFDRESNTDDAITFEDFEQDVEEYLNDNCEADCKNAKKLRTGANYMENLWHQVCADLEEFYKGTESEHKCDEHPDEVLLYDGSGDFYCEVCDKEDEESGESFTRTCQECDDDFTPSVEHAKDGVCDECVSEKGRKQILIRV